MLTDDKVYGKVAASRYQFLISYTFALKLHKIEACANLCLRFHAFILFSNYF